MAPNKINVAGQPYRECVLVPVKVNGGAVGYAVRHDDRSPDTAAGEVVAYLPEKFFQDRGL